MTSGTQHQKKSQACIGLPGRAIIALVSQPIISESQLNVNTNTIYKFIVFFISISGGLRALVGATGLYPVIGGEPEPPRPLTEAGRLLDRVRPLDLVE
jgi:hypothetical protein